MKRNQNVLGLFAFLALVLLFTLGACESQESEFLELNDEVIASLNVEDMDRHGDRKHARIGIFRLLKGDCIDIEYPVVIEFPDGSTLSVDDLEGLLAALRDWHQGGHDSLGRPALVYPITITVADTTFQVNSNEALRRAARLCKPDRPHDKHHILKLLARCIEIEYPVTLLFPDGSSATVDNQEELVMAIRNWHQTHPDSLGAPTFDYPITVTIRDSTLTISSNEELRRAAVLCQRDRPGDDRDICFKLVYPLSIEFPDGSIVEVENRRQRLKVIKRWKSNNPTSAARPTFVYPIEIMFRDGSFQTIHSADEFQAAKAACD